MNYTIIEKDMERNVNSCDVSRNCRSENDLGRFFYSRWRSEHGIYIYSNC